MASPKEAATMPKSIKFLFGGTAGMAATMFVQPLDLIKNRMQMSGEGGKAREHKTSFHALRSVLRNEGVRGIYTGLSAGLLRQATYTTTRLGVYTILFERFSTEGKPPSFLIKASIGMTAGAVGSFIGTPAEVSLIRMTSDGRLPPDQRRGYTNVFNALTRITREEGVLTLWRGCGPTVVRAMVVNAAQLASYSQAKQFVLGTGYFSDNILCHFVASMISGLVTTAASMPVDIAKTRVQNMKMIDGKPEYKGAIMVTANCVPLLSADTMATNGVVHVVGKVLSPVEKTILELIDAEPKLSIFKSLLEQTELGEKLRRAPGQITVFVPTDEAFRKLPPVLGHKLMEGHNCVDGIIKNHVLDNVICSSVLDGRVKSLNELGNYLNLTRTEGGHLRINDAEIIIKDLMATNGVVHIIDTVLLPDEDLSILDCLSPLILVVDNINDDSLSIVEVAENAGASKILDLLEEAKLLEQLVEMDNITIFLPTDHAVELLPDEMKKKLIDDPEFLQEALLYHIFEGQKEQDELLNDLELITMQRDKKVTIKKYHSYPFSMQHIHTAQCAPISKTDLKACGVTAHLVDRMLLPPAGHILQVLEGNPEFSRLVDLLQGTVLWEMLSKDGPYTIFAPTNEVMRYIFDFGLTSMAATSKRTVVNGPVLIAIQGLKYKYSDIIAQLDKRSVAWDHIETEYIESLEDKDFLIKLLKKHIIRGTLCCAGVMNSHHGLWRNRESSLYPSYSLSVNRGQDGDIVIGSDSQVVGQCDITATNGVVHGIDRIISDALPRQRHLSRRGREWMQNIRHLLEKRFGNLTLMSFGNAMFGTGSDWD